MSCMRARQELCEEVTVLRATVKELRETFAERLEEQTTEVVEEAVRSAVAVVREEAVERQKADTGMIDRLQKALAAALAVCNK